MRQSTLICTGLLLVALAVVPSAQDQVTAMPHQSAASAPAWNKLVDKAAFSPRDTAEDCVFGGKMWISNGYYHGGVLTRDLWQTADGLTWERVSDATPYDGYSEMVAYDGKMWAVKGSVWSSSDGVNWTCELEKTPFGRRGYGELVVFKGKMWQLGSGADVWNTTDGATWTQVTAAVPYGKRAASAVVVFDDKLWLIGGRITAQNTPPEKGYKKFTTFNDVWCSTDGKEWTCVLESAPWPPRMWFVAQVYRDRLWTIGGYSNVNAKNLGDVWSTQDGATWTEFKAEPCFEPRHEPTCYVFDDSLWVVAGNTWPVRNDVWRLTLGLTRK